jgi:hypothetical protein
VDRLYKVAVETVKQNQWTVQGEVIIDIGQTFIFSPFVKFMAFMREKNIFGSFVHEQHFALKKLMVLPLN